MAFADNKATVTCTTQILPAEISKNISGTLSFTPAGNADKWYYKLTSVVHNSSQLLISAGANYLDNTSTASQTEPSVVAAGDKIKFLFIKNLNSVNSLYLSLGDADGTPDTTIDASSDKNLILIRPSETLTMTLNGSEVQDVTIEATTGTTECLVAAIITDV